MGENPGASAAAAGGVSLSRQDPVGSVNKRKYRIPNMLRGQKNLAVIPDEVGRASWPADGQAVPYHGPAWGDREREETAEPPCRSSVHLQVPLRISSSVFFLDKSLLISLEGLGGGGGGGGGVENRTSYRSTLSVRLGAATRSRLPAAASEEEKKDERSRSRSRSGRAPLRGLQGPEVEPSAPVRRVNGRSGDSEEQRRRPLGSFSFPRPNPSHCEEQQEDVALLHTTPSRSESDGTGSRSVHPLISDANTSRTNLIFLCATRS